MNIQGYIEKIKTIQESVLKYIEDENAVEENFQILAKSLDEYNFKDSREDLKLYLCLLSRIANNHYRNFNFFVKIEKLLQPYQNETKKFFSNIEIFNIFKGNKRILLFLIKSKWIEIDKYFIKKITNYKYIAANYPQYFFPEIKEFLTSDQKSLFDPKIDDSFEEKRNIGENEEFICELIRKDLIKEFIIQINKTSLSLDYKIKLSIFETNPFIIENQNPTLIQYAAFFGSIQIFQYLQINKVKLFPSLWHYAIHGYNSEIINFLEDNKVEPFIKINFKNDDDDNNEEEEGENESNNKDKAEEKNKYRDCLKESIICHHNDIAKYILQNFYQKVDPNLPYVFSIGLKYYNFEQISIELITESSFYSFCKFGYYSFVDFLLKEKEINVNKINKENEFSIKIISADKITDNEEDVLTDPIIVTVLNQKNKKDTALYVAIKKQNFGIAALLLKNEKIDVNIENTCLTIESPCNRRLYPNEITTKRTALNMALEIGNFEIIKLLLSNENIDVNKKSIKIDYHKWGPGPEQGKYTTENPPLFIALEIGDMEIYNFLLENEKIDVNSIQRRIQMNPYGIFQNFIEHETTLLNEFVENKDIENIKLLLETGKVDVNIPSIVKNYSQFTQFFSGTHTVEQKESQKVAIQIAVEIENIEIIKLLLEQKDIDVDIEDDNCISLIDKANDPQIKKLIGDALESRPKTSEFAIEPICTFEASGESMIDQNFFLCKTCGVNQHDNSVEGCCEVCMRRCHKGHVIEKIPGVVSSFCDCPGSGKCQCNKHEDNLKCTGEITNGEKVTQPMYQCKDCGISGDSYICQNCAINHHHGHKLIFKYKVKNVVCCNYNPT